jgi:predicted RNA methylase
MVPEGMNVDMLNMEGRLELILKPGLDQESRGRTVADLGCGTGVLGIYALEKGADFVYFVEQDDQMIHILENILPKKLNKSKFKIIHKDIENLTLQDFESNIPNVAVSEFYGPRLFDEGYVNYVRHVKKLFPDCKFIPEKFCGTFYFIDIDYSQPIWPKDKELVDYFKFMYQEKGFARYIESPSEKTLVGKIEFDANTGNFANNLEFNYPFITDKILLGVMTAEYKNYIHEYTTIGWLFAEDEYNKKFRITFDELNYFNPIKVCL